VCCCCHCHYYLLAKARVLVQILKTQSNVYRNSELLSMEMLCTHKVNPRHSANHTQRPWKSVYRNSLLHIIATYHHKLWGTNSGAISWFHMRLSPFATSHYSPPRHSMVTLCELNDCNATKRRSQWPRGLRRRSTAACLLWSWFRIPPGMDACLLCVVRWRFLRRADHSPRGVLPTVARCCVWSRNLVNEEVIARAGLQIQRK
jgi:hypothetical protein